MDKDVKNYIDSIEDAQRKQDVSELVKIIAEVGRQKPTMYNSSIVAFGLYHYKYDSGLEGDAPKVGLSNRKNAIVVYGLLHDDPKHPNNELIKSFGKYKTGKSCVYINKLSDVDTEVLKKLVANSYL